MGPRLAAYLSREAGAEVRVVAIAPMAGGASREMFSVDVDVEDGPEKGRRALVLRRDLGGRIYDQALDRAGEFKVIAEARRAKVRVPEPRWLCEDPAVLGAPFFLQDRVAGETIGRRIVKDPALADARPRLAGEMAEELARIHTIDTTRLPFLPRPRDGMTPAESELAYARGQLDRLREAHPVIELALAWLGERVPETGAPTFVHGDFRVGNVVVGPSGLEGVLDWEFAHVGDPLEDLAWPLVRSWRFGVDAKEVGGVGDRGPYVETYAKASGRDVRLGDVRFWEILGNVRWAIGCVAQANRHLSGQSPSVEFASLGRKTAEMELDLLDLLEATRDA